MLLQVLANNPDDRIIYKVVDSLNRGGVIIVPTDTVYAIVCALSHPKSIEKIARIKGIKTEKANFSLLCASFAQVSEYARQIDNPVFKLMKQHLPGPYTFILEAGNKLSKILDSKKKTVGIRIPDHRVIQALVHQLGCPLVSTSVHDDDEILEYITDPELIHERYGCEVDMVIDSGYGHNVASTIIDCTKGEPLVIRQGIGEV